MDKDIRIFVTYKEKHKLLKSDFIVPIQTGRAIADEIFEGMIGDDSGINISSLNPYYAELTAQYWVWKNYEEIGNPYYIGFMQYRRHFIFNDNDYIPDIGGCIPFKEINEEYIENINLNKEAALSFVDGYDCVTTKIELNYISQLRKDPRWSTAQGSWDAIIDLDPKSHKIMLDTLREYDSSYEPIIDEYLNSNVMHWYVSYIMTKELFFEYCEFLFPLLAKIEPKIETKYYSKNAQRILGYMAERIHTLFIMKKLKENRKIKFANLTFVKNTDDKSNEKIQPVFDAKNVIVLASSKSFLPYTIVAIQSIISNASKKNKYDIVLLNNSSTQYYDRVLQNMCSENVSIRVFNPDSFVKSLSFEKFKLWDRLSPITFWRLLSPELFSFYNKILFFDADMIALEDLNKLFELDMEGKPIAAVKEYEVARCINNERIKEKYNIITFFNDFGIKNIDNYFNAGLLVFDVQKCFEFDYPKKYKEKLEKTDVLLLADQDIINYIFNDNYYQLSAQYNVCWQIPVNSKGFYKRQLPFSFYEEYEYSRKNPIVIHYCGKHKPWINTDIELADYWWKYARQSLIYENLLHLHLKQRIPDSVNYPMLVNTLQRKRILLKFWKYKILQNFVFGKKREEYRAKKYKYKQRYQQIQDFIRTYKNAF